MVAPDRTIGPLHLEDLAYGVAGLFAEQLLKRTDDYDGLDQLNRHGILHGIFES